MGDTDNHTKIPSSDQLISLSEGAKLYGLTQGHLAHLVRKGDLWGLKIGRNWVTTKTAIEEYLSHNPKPGPKPPKKA